MYERELTLEDAQNIQKILKWALTTKENIEDYTRIFPPHNPDVDRDLFVFYMDHILSINPKVIKEAAVKGGYITSTHLRTYLEQGGFLKTFKDHIDKKSFDDKIKQLMHDELETSINTSKQAIIISKKSNDIADTNKKYAIWAFWLAVAAFVISVLTFIFKK